MSVTSCVVKNTTGEITEELHREYTVSLEIQTNTASDGPVVVLAYVAGVYPYGTPYARGNDYDQFAVVRKIGPVKPVHATDRKQTMWSCELKYSTKGTKRDPNDQPGDPLQWSWKISGASGAGQKWLTKDRTGRALVNSADEPFEDVPPIDDPLIVLSLQKNTPTLSLSQWRNSRGKVNSATLWGLSRRKVKLREWKWDIAWTSAGVAYVDNKFEVEINEDGYNYQPADVGTREKTGVDQNGNTTYEVILIKGEIPARPQFLDGAGRRKTDAADVVYFDGLNGNPDPFELEDEYDFSAFFPAVLPGPIVS